MQVAGTLSPPGAAGRPHRPEHRRQVANIARLHLPMADPVGVDDRADAPGSDGVLLTQGAQVQVVLEQQPRHLPAVGLQMLLELVMGPAVCLGAGEGGGQGSEGGTGASKGVLGQHARHSVVADVVVVGLHRALSRRSGVTPETYEEEPRAFSFTCTGRCQPSLSNVAATPAAQANSPGSASTSQPRSTSRLSLVRIPSRCRGSAPAPTAWHTCLARSGRPASASTSTTSR
jgi:hypothetical protein